MSTSRIKDASETDRHKEKVNRIIRELKGHEGNAPLSIKKKTVSHEVPKLHDRRHTDKKIDISDLDSIIHIDSEKQICTAEPGVTFARIVEATIKYNLVPMVVPELKTITLGGAVAGCSIESMSYRYGSFHDSCLEYEVVNAKGDRLICTPDNENKLLFQMIHGTFGTLGIITLLKFKLISAKPFVKINYERYKNLEDYKDAIWEHYEKRDVDFMDGIIHSPGLYVLSTADFVDSAPYTHRYDWMRIYYKSTAERKEDYLETFDYFFRYDKGVTNVHPKSIILRLLFGKLVNSNNVLMFANIFRKVLSQKLIPITVDTFIPFSKIDEFMGWYKDTIGHYPLWCVPYRIAHRYEWISDGFLERIEDDLFLDIAIYGMRRKDPEYYYRILDKKLFDIGAVKTLISTNTYSEEEFWKIWNKKNYELVKRENDPDNIFRDLYEKMCLAAKGTGR